MPRRSGGKTEKMIAITSGCATPALKPCTVRKMISTSSVGAAPPNSAPTEKKNSAPTKVRRSPSTPVIQAFISMPAVIAAA